MATATIATKETFTGVLSDIPNMAPVLLAIALAISSVATASTQQRAVVVDQTGLPLPGAHVEIRRGDRVVASYKDVVLRDGVVGEAVILACVDVDSIRNQAARV